MSLGVNSDALLGARQGGVCGRRVACRETTGKGRLGPVGWAGRPGLSCLYLVGRWELWNVFERTVEMGCAFQLQQVPWGQEKTHQESLVKDRSKMG